MFLKTSRIDLRPVNLPGPLGGLLLVVEGPDAVGKGSVIQELHTQAEAQGNEVEKFFMGSTELGRWIYDVAPSDGVDKTAGAFLFLASLRQVMIEKIAPTIKAGKLVIMDRFLLSTAIYQSRVLQALPISILMDAAQIIQQEGGVVPSLYAVLHADERVFEERLKRAGTPSDFDKNQELQKNVRALYRSPLILADFIRRLSCGHPVPQTMLDTTVVQPKEIAAQILKDLASIREQQIAKL